MRADPHTREATTFTAPLRVGNGFRFILATMLTAAICASQEDLLKTVTAQGFGLVEIGSYGKIRTLAFGNPYFTTRKMQFDCVLVGVTETGRELIISAQSPYSGRKRHQLALSTLEGDTIATIHPLVRGMSVQYAEASPDRSSIAFVGSVLGLSDTAVRFGLHQVDRSGAVRTFVSTTEAEEPRSIGWASDGRRLVYDTGHHVYIYNLETNTSIILADGSYPTWSPDGLWITYRRRNGTAAITGPDGVSSRRILDETQIRGGLRWSPDSRYLLVTDRVGIKVLELANGDVASVLAPLDQYSESRLRWVRGLFQ